MSLPPREEPRVLTVLELTRWIKDLLEVELGRVWVEGEISGWKLHARSGHAYFSLKDEQDDALLSCVVWASTLRRIRLRPRDGMRVRVAGRVSVYEPRGSYQLYVDRIALHGEGELQAAFAALKARLEAEGLFDPARKVPLPRFPRRIGIVTAPDGAALHDMLRILARRWPLAEVYLWPAVVQGVEAVPSLVEGIETMDGLGGLDVLIVGRGGGSLEDLWAFNEEAVARALAGCLTPVVSAVGHEIDFTIADFVADVRAATPTHAAELVTPEAAELLRRLAREDRVLRRRLLETLRTLRLRTERLASDRAFREPESRLRRGQMDLDRLADRLRAALAEPTARGRSRLQRLSGGFARLGPEVRIERGKNGLRALGLRAERAVLARTERGGRRLEVAGARLRALGPGAVLRRGYGIVRHADGRVVRSAAQTEIGDPVAITLAAGELECRVEARTLPPEERGGG